MIREDTMVCFFKSMFTLRDGGSKLKGIKKDIKDVQKWINEIIGCS